MRRTLCLTLCAALLGLSALRGDDKAKDEKFDPAKLVGTWTYVSAEKGGEKKGADDLKGQTVVITKETLTLKSEGGTFVMKFEFDAKQTPVKVKLTMTESPFGAGATASGVIAVKGDELKLCYAAMGGEAPTKFEAKKDSDQRLLVLKRSK